MKMKFGDNKKKPGKEPYKIPEKLLRKNNCSLNHCAKIKIDHSLDYTDNNKQLNNLFIRRRDDLNKYNTKGYHQKTCYICWKKCSSDEDFVESSSNNEDLNECKDCSRSWHFSCFGSKEICSVHVCSKDNCNKNTRFDCKYCFKGYCEDHLESEKDFIVKVIFNRAICVRCSKLSEVCSSFKPLF